eukprot:3541020-Prymnesium_polylepis.1
MLAHLRTATTAPCTFSGPFGSRVVGPPLVSHAFSRPPRRGSTLRAGHVEEGGEGEGGGSLSPPSHTWRDVRLPD